MTAKRPAPDTTKPPQPQKETAAPIDQSAVSTAQPDVTPDAVLKAITKEESLQKDGLQVSVYRFVRQIISLVINNQ